MVWMGPDTPARSALPVVAEGLFAATPVATPSGWCPAGDLSPGDLVLTFDDGPQPLNSVYETVIAEPPPALWPLRVPVWALDNRDEILLLPQQRVLIEADQAENLFGDPFALIPAEALEPWRGICRARPLGGEVVVQLTFARPQILYASRGVLLSCAGEDWVALETGPTTQAASWADPGHTVCSPEQSRHLVACLMAEEAGAELAAAARRGWFRRGT